MSVVLTLLLIVLPILQKKLLSELAISASDVKVRFDLSTIFEILHDVLFFFGLSIGPSKAHTRKTAFALSFKMLSKQFASACLKQFVKIFLYVLYFSVDDWSLRKSESL